MRSILALKALAIGCLTLTSAIALIAEPAAAHAGAIACPQPAQEAGPPIAPFAALQAPACAHALQMASNTQVARASKSRKHKRSTRSAKPTQQQPAAQTTQATSAKVQAPPPRATFTPKDENIAVIPGIPDARFWADSEEDYRRVLGDKNGPWLALSAGGEDSAFGAGILNGLSETGRRPDYVVVSGVSSGALLAPYAFLGSARDADLKREATSLTAPDVFEDHRTAESLLDTWPLREFIAKRITPELLAAIAAEHKRGRRLIVITTNIDNGRPVAWNMGAIAAAGTKESLELFRKVLLATSAIPGLFPPVLFDVEANGHRFQEMHVDGGLGATIYVAPDSMLLSSAPPRFPASQITLILNSKLMAEFAMTDRHLVGVLGRSLSLGVKRATRTAAILIGLAARRAGTEFNVAYVDQKFDIPSRGLFDPDYMKALFDVGLKLGRSETPFHHTMPESQPAQAAAPPEKTSE